MTLSDLCLACGLCCDGTLFQVVSLSAAEAGALTVRGLAVAEHQGRWDLGLPCQALVGTACGLYGERPWGCRRFTCLVGRRLEAGSVAPGEACAWVDQVHALRRRVEADWPPPPGTPEVAFARRALGAPSAEVPAAVRPLVGELEALLREHFLGV